MGRLFAVPDIHGRLDLLEKLLELLFTQEKLDLTIDKLIFLGDMIDRGPDSYGVIECIKNLQEAHPMNVIALLGNHEGMCVLYYGRGKLAHDAHLWFSNGGYQTEDSYKRVGHSNMTQEHLIWLAYLPLKHEEPGYWFSHAPVPRESYRLVVNRDQPFTPEELTWTYNSDEQGVARDHGNGIIGISGHIHQLRKGIMTPRFYPHHYYLDCGAGCSMKAPLVAVELDTKKVVYAWP